MVRERFWNTCLVLINKAYRYMGWIWILWISFCVFPSMIWGSWGLVYPNCPANSCSCLALVSENNLISIKISASTTEHWVYDNRKVEEVCPYWVAGLHCPVHLTCSQVKLRLLREITCMRVCWLCIRHMCIFQSMHEKYENYDKYYDDYYDGKLRRIYQARINYIDYITKINYITNSAN